jgi:hypothetical protein
MVGARAVSCGANELPSAPPPRSRTSRSGVVQKALRGSDVAENLVRIDLWLTLFDQRNKKPPGGPGGFFAPRVRER